MKSDPYHFTQISKRLFAIILLGLLFISSNGQQTQSTPMMIQEGIIYPNLSQDFRSFSFYSFQISNKSQAFLNSSYLFIRVDIDDSSSDPDILIAKPNAAKGPKSQLESDQYCVKTGSNICFLRKNSYKLNDTLLFSVRCINKCTYTMKIGYSAVNNVTDGSKLSLRLDGRSANVFQFQIPDVSYDGPTQSIYFQVDTVSITSQIQISYSNTDDISMMEERDADIITDTGKAIKFSSDDFGWCTKCSVFFIISVRSPDTYLISGKSTSRKEFLQDQITLSRQISQQQRECFSYPVTRASSDVVFFTKQQQGDLDVSVTFRNSQNNSIEQQIIQSEVYPSRALIIRSGDRQRFTQLGSSPLYLCITPYTDSSLLMTPNQQYYQSRFDAIDDTLYSYILDSQDYVYFRYTSPYLATSRQIQVQVQSFATLTNSIAIPRVFYRVCQSPNAEECSLSDNLAMGYWDENVILTEINSIVDNTTQIRTGIINHNPLSCPIPTSCYYLISAFKDDQSGLQKSTFRLNLLNPDPIPIGIFQQYQDIIGQAQLQYFQLVFSQIQLQNFNFTNLNISLTSFNGKISPDLLISTTNKNPNLTNNEQRVRTLSSWNLISINLIGRDLSKTVFYIGVYGNVQSTYQLRVNADYIINNPVQYQNLSANTTNGSAAINMTQLILNLTNQTSVAGNSSNSSANNSSSGVQNSTNLTIYPLPLQEGMRGQYQLNSNMTDIVLFYQPQSQSFNQRAIHLSPTIDAMTVNSSLSFNVSYGNYSWNNNTIGLTVTPDQWKYDPSSIFIIRIRADFSRVNRSNLNITNSTQNRNVSQAAKPNATNILLNLTMRFGIFTSYYSTKDIQITKLNTQYEGFANYSTVVFKHLLLDTNGTYIFTLYNSIGKPYFMEKNGPLLLQDYDITDDTTYDFASSSVDSQETQTITVTKFMRENANFRCKNASFSLRGGNENCTMFIAIQCNQICIFNLSIGLLEAKNRTVDVPQLFRQGDKLNSQIVMGGNKPNNYYYPFMRQNIRDTAITLNKLSNDSFIVARVISNGFLPYFNWSFPNQISYDFISRTPSRNFELIDLSSPNLLNRCPLNSSCILLVSVYSSSSLNNTRSIYNLALLSGSNRMGNATLLQGFINEINHYDYYWFLINGTNITTKQPQVWKHLITAATQGNIGDQEVDLYVTASDGELPSSENFDFKGDRLGNDAITLSSDLSFFKNQVREKYLVVIGVKARSANVSYTLMNWGPNNYDGQLISFTDLALKQLQNITLPTRVAKPINNYRILRYFNYGSLDLIFNITATDGQIYVLANNNRFKHYQINSYFTVPIVNQSSKIPFQSLNKTKSYILRVNQNNNRDMLCTFCWIYIAVYQNNSLPTATSTFTINVTDNSNSDQIQTLRIGDIQTQQIVLAGSALQRKFIFDSKEQFTLQVSAINSVSGLPANFTVYLGNSTDYLNNDRIWQASGNQRQVYKQKQSDRNFSIGMYYYITVVAISSSTNVTLSLNQRRAVGLLKDQTINLDRMITSEDYVKYYYFIPPSIPTNYSVAITVTPRTQGFFPSFYVQRNDLLNNTFSFQKLTFPSMNKFTFAQEQQFFQTPQTSYSFTYNVSAVNFTSQLSYVISQNVTINQTNLVNVTQTIFNTTTKKNQTVTVLQNQTIQVNVTRNQTVIQNISTVNQTYYTLAVYFNNFGLTDLQRAEYEISLSLRPLGRSMILQNEKPILKFQNQYYETASPLKFLQDDRFDSDTGILNYLGDSFKNLVDMVQFI